MPKCKPTTPSQRERWALLREYGCICCRKEGLVRYPEIHHITDCGRRIGHDATIPLCAWHHRGEPVSITSTKKMAEAWLGPSLAESKLRFQRVFGSERELLSEVNTWLGESQGKGGVKRVRKASGSSFPF